MASLNFPTSKTLVYPRSTVERAIRALACSPFRLGLFMAMRNHSIPLSAIARSEGYQQGFTRRTLSELACEDAALWLINVGILRREVDGQGITDSYRLTPLGHQLISEFTELDWPAPSCQDRLKNALTRWFKIR
jgi:hypothetical protein